MSMSARTWWPAPSASCGRTTQRPRRTVKPDTAETSTSSVSSQSSVTAQLLTDTLPVMSWPANRDNVNLTARRLPAPAAKSGQLDDSDLEVFRKQAACLNFPAEFHFGKLTGERLQSFHCARHTHSSKQRGWRIEVRINFPFPPLFQTCVLRRRRLPQT